MPIRSENKDRYPKDWKAISKRIREAAGNKCQKCGVENGAVVTRVNCEDYPEPVYITEDGGVFSAEDGKSYGMNYPAAYGDQPMVKIVLTVAHIDHQPENCADENLRAWCQRCHNHYDAKTRAKGVQSRRRSAGGRQADMFA